MRKVLVQPCGNKDAMIHYDNTVTNGINVANIADRLPSDVLDLLKKEGTKKIKVWGFVDTDAIRNRWERLSSGDIVLFYGKKKTVLSGRGTCNNQRSATRQRLVGRR